MRAAALLLGALVVGAGAFSGASAQEGAAAPVPAATSSAPSRAIPSGVERVRQRLGGVRAPVYVIVVPAPAPASQQTAAPPPAADAGRRYTRTPDGRYIPIFPAAGPAPTQFVRVDQASDVAVPDSAGVPVGAGSPPAFFPASPSRLDAVPAADPTFPAGYGTVREVERALFEGGLFRAVGINFEFGKSRLLGGAGALVDPVGDVLQRYPEIRLEVAGHTDSVGGDAANQRLSEARARTIVDYLVSRWGVDPSRLVAAGYGETQPLVTNDNPTGRTLNRRVEFRILPGE